MARINYQVAKLMLVFANEEHARTKRMAHEIYNAAQEEMRLQSFLHSGKTLAMEHYEAFADALGRVGECDEQSHEFAVMSGLLEEIILDEDMEFAVRDLIRKCNEN